MHKDHPGSATFGFKFLPTLVTKGLAPDKHPTPPQQEKIANSSKKTGKKTYLRISRVSH
jgi:hypothetical protein